MLTPTLKWKRQTAMRPLKGGGAFHGVVGSVAVLESAEAAIREGAETGMHRLAAAMQEYARANKKWTRRTGEAEENLDGFAGKESGPGGVGGGSFFAGIRHGAEHGVYLESRFNSRYAIIGPTQEVFADRAAGIVKEEIELELRGKGSQFRHRASGQFT